MMMSTTTRFFTVSSSTLPCRRSHCISSPPPLFPTSPFKKQDWGKRFVLLNVKCELERSVGPVESESVTTLSSLSSAAIDEDDRSISSYRWCAALGGLGFLETAYLTYLKLSYSDAFCPMGVKSCNPILALKNFGLERIKRMLGSQLCIASLVIIVLSTSYNVSQPISLSLAATEMPYVETEITAESSPLALSLARHLHSIGAKLYGAFWCSHCVHQKQIFGREAAQLLDYVECYPDGIKEGTKMAEACYDVDLKAFPTWVIDGQLFSGEKRFPELAELSGVKLEELSQ